MRMQEWAERNNYTTAPLYVDLAVRFIHETAFAISTRRGCACCASVFLLCVCLFPSPAQLISEAELPCLRHSCMIMCAQSKAVLLQRIKAVVHLHKMQTVQAGGAHQPSPRESQLFITACEGARQQAILNDTRCTFLSFRKFWLDSSEYLPTVSLHFAHHRPISRAPRS